MRAFFLLAAYFSMTNYASTEEIRTRKDLAGLFCEAISGLTTGTSTLVDYFFFTEKNAWIFRGDTKIDKMIEMPLTKVNVHLGEHPWRKDEPDGVIFYATRNSPLADPNSKSSSGYPDYVFQYNTDDSLINGHGDEDATYTTDWIPGNGRLFVMEGGQTIKGEKMNVISPINCAFTEMPKEEIIKVIIETLKGN